MKFMKAIIAAAILASVPGAAQSGSVTYEVGVNGVDSVTVDYDARTITEYYTNGFSFTHADGTGYDFDAAARWYEQQYGWRRERVPRQHD